MTKQRWTDNDAPLWQQVLFGSVASVVLLTAFLGCLYWMAHKASDILAEDKERYNVVLQEDGTKYACPTDKAFQQHKWTCRTDAECVEEYKQVFNADPNICHQDPSGI